VNALTIIRNRQIWLGVILAGSLTGCAVLQGDSGSDSAPAASAAGTAPVQRNPAQVIQEPARQAPQPTAEELGINREGRVIQLGRFSEVQPPVTPPDNNVVELNYEQEDLKLVFEQLGDALGINMVIDPTIDYRVSLRTSANNPLRYEDIWPLMRLLARNAGVTIEQAGNVYQFSRNASRIPVEILLPGFLGQATASEVLQVTPLSHISVEAAEEILRPLMQPEGSLIRLGSANLIGISGTPEQLARVNALLSVVDDDPFQNQGIRLFELVNSPAAEVAEELGSVLELIEGEQSSYQVLGLDRINAVLVVAPANRGFAEISRWIRILDAESQEQVEQLFVYKVKNLDAVALASTLTSVFGEDDEEDTNANRQDNQNATGGVVFRAGQAADGGNNAPVPPFVQFLNGQNQQAGADSEIVSANLSVTIVADEDTNSLLIRATPREYRQLLTTISNLDTVPAQVLINAVIGQVTLTDGNQFGIDWARVSGNIASGPARLSSRFLPAGILDSTTGLATQGSGLVLTRNYLDGNAVIEATLNAIAQDNEVKLLARPTILATNKQEGTMQVGQSVPVNNGSTAVGNGIVQQNITYTEIGISLTITPQINEDGYINLEIQQELSSIEEGGSNGVGNNPTFTTQSITTTAVVADQQTITLGGLIQEDSTDLQIGIPGLMRIPVAGRLFSYSDISSVRRELFVILRPQIIYGDQRDAALLQEFRDSFTNVRLLLEDAGL
jgi:general secretion pathway protein D